MMLDRRSFLYLVTSKMIHQLFVDIVVFNLDKRTEIRIYRIVIECKNEI